MNIWHNLNIREFRFRVCNCLSSTNSSQILWGRYILFFVCGISILGNWEDPYLLTHFDFCGRYCFRRSLLRVRRSICEYLGCRCGRMARRLSPARVKGKRVVEVALFVFFFRCKAFKNWKGMFSQPTWEYQVMHSVADLQKVSSTASPQ